MGHSHDPMKSSTHAADSHPLDIGLIGTVCASAQEQRWAAAPTKPGEYPSVAEARDAVRTHLRMVDQIAAGRTDEAQRIARRHLAATRALVLERFIDDVVNATPARSWRARAVF